MVKPYHHGDLRRALLDETLEQIRHGMTSKLSLRSIASAVGVTPAAAYHHFPDKDALLDCAVGEIGILLGQALGAAVQAAPAGQQSLAMGFAYIDFAVAEPALFSDLMSRECEQAHEVQESSLELVRAALVHDGVLVDQTPEESELAVFTAWAVVHGFASLVLTKRMSAAQAREAFRAHFTSQTARGPISE